MASKGYATQAFVTNKIAEAQLSGGGAINELFQSVSDGKRLLASALTDKGIPTLATESFEEMAQKILQITTSNPNPPTTSRNTITTKAGDTIITKSGDTLVTK